MSAVWRAVARVVDVPRGELIAVEVEGLELVVGRDGGRYFATQRRCLHRGGDLAEGIISRGHLICPIHAWRFSTETGCVAQASEPPEYCLATYPVRVVGDAIEVDVQPREATARSDA
jgi:nitrite reductase/ring-hydroxylating ferredoxin subunit